MRNWIVATQAVVVFGVFAAFSLSFHALQMELHASLGPSAQPCQTLATLQWATHTPLDQWSTTPASLLTQGRSPEHVVLRTCSVEFSGGLPLTDWQTNRWDDGWFNLTKLQEALLSPAAK